MHILKEEIAKVQGSRTPKVPRDVVMAAERDIKAKFKIGPVVLSDKRPPAPWKPGMKAKTQNDVMMYGEASSGPNEPGSSMMIGEYVILAFFTKTLAGPWMVTATLEFCRKGESRYDLISVFSETYKTKMNESKEVLEESKGHFVIVKAAVVANIDSTLKSVVSKWDGTVRQKKKDGSFMNHILSFKSKTDADRARQAIEDEEIELIRSVNYRDELV